MENVIRRLSKDPDMLQKYGEILQEQDISRKKVERQIWQRTEYTIFRITRYSSKNPVQHQYE